LPSDSPSPSDSASPAPSDSPGPTDPDPKCAVGDKLVPTCGVLWGVAPGAHTSQARDAALVDFETKTGRPQTIYHAYHQGTNEVFPTRMEIAIARNKQNPRLLFLNWKPTQASWAKIAAGDAETDSFLDALAAHLRYNFPEKFFFTIYHEPEDNVDPAAGSGYTAKDYAAMFRHVIERLRARGATNIVSTMDYMAYVPWNTKPWFTDLYPGDDVVDWVAWDAYAYSDPGYGYGDFAEMINRRSSSKPAWPGFYNWAAQNFPDKPLMVGEWGVWYSDSNPGHMADFYDSVAAQIQSFPRIKALVYFDTPSDQRGRDSRVDRTAGSLDAYRRLSQQPTFEVSAALAAINTTR
jgi:hypothetical protein